MSALIVSRAKVDALFEQLGMPLAKQWSLKRLNEKVSKLPEVIDEDTDSGEHGELLESLLSAINNKQEIEITEGKPAAEAKAKAADKPKKSKKAAEPEVEEEEEEDEEEEKPKSKKSKKAAEEEEEDEDPAPAKKSKKSSSKKSKEDDAEDEEDEEEEEDKPKKSKKSAKKADADDEDADDSVPLKKKDKEKKKKTVGGPGVIASIVEFLKQGTAKKPMSKDKMCEMLAERFPDRSAESMMRTINVQVPNRLKADKGLTVIKTDKGYYIEE